MPTVYATACSLDGFVATVDHSLDWLFPLGDPADTGLPEFVQGVGAIAMGSATYAWMLRHVVRPPAAPPGAWPYEVPTFVFSSRPQPGIDDVDLRFVRGDVRPVHAEMLRVAAGRDLWIVGGGDLAGRFLDAGLIDEIVLHVGSVTLGAGRPAIPRAIVSPPLRLLAARAVGEGLAELRYAVPRVAEGRRS